MLCQGVYLSYNAFVEDFEIWELTML